MRSRLLVEWSCRCESVAGKGDAVASSNMFPFEVFRSEAAAANLLIKSITAREMWEQHESYLEKYLWGGGFWEQSYYIGTAGQVSSETIERYIERTEHI